MLALVIVVVLFLCCFSNMYLGNGGSNIFLYLYADYALVDLFLLLVQCILGYVMFIGLKIFVL